MSDKKQELVDLISALQVLSATSDLAKKALDDVFGTDVAVPSEDLAPGITSIQEYVSEIGDNKKLINDYLTWLRKAVSDINKAQADISDTIVSDTFSAGSGTPEIVAGGGSSSAGKSHKADVLRRQLEETRSKAQLAYRTEDQEALQQYIEDIKELQDELESLDGDVAEMIESFSEQVERAIDSVRSVKSGRSSSGRGGRGSRSTTLLTDAEIQAAVEQYNLTTAGDSRDRTGTIKVKLPSQKNTRSTEKEHIAQLVARIEKSGMFENRDDYSEEGKAIVDELASLITDIKDPKNKSKKSSISQKIRASFQKISNANNTFSTAQVTSIQEDIIKPVMEVLSKAGISDKVLESAAVAKPDDKAIKDAISRVVSMLVTEQSGRYVRVGESVVDNNMMQIMSPDALNRVIRNLGSIVRRSAVKEVIPRGETASLHLLNVLQEAFSDTSAITLASKKDLDTPQDSGALSSTRMHPQYQTSDRANFNAFRRSMRASFNPSLRYGREAQGVDTRAGSQIVASSASAAFGTGFDSIVKKAVDELLTQVRDDISNGNVRSVKVAGNEVELPQALAQMVIEAIQTSAVLSEHTTAMGRMAGDVGPRGAFESGDAVKKVVALFAGDLINQYRTAGGISENAAESFMNETITPAEEKEVALAVTHAQRLRERLTFRRDRASLSMVTASPAGALGYQKEVAQLTKEIELLDEIMRQSDDPEEEKRIAARRGQIALPESTSPVALTRDQALTVIFRAPIGTVPAIPDAVGPTVDKARQVSAGLASAGLTVPVKPTYGTNPVQSVVDFAKTGQDQALERFKTVPIGSQLDETSDATGRMSDKEIIDIISDAFGLSRQSASQGNAITGIYYGGRATDSAGNLLEGDTLDQSLGGGFRTRKGIQSIVQAAAEMSSYGSSGLPIIDYARLATTKDRTAEEQEMFDQVQAKLPHLQTIGSENLEKLAQLDTSMDPQQLIKRVMTLAAPAIQEQIRQLIQRQGASSKMTSSEIDAMMKDFEDTGTAPEGFKAAFHALSMFDPKNINTSDVTAEINRSFSLFSTLLGGQVRPGENIAQFAARILGREDRLKSTSMSSSVSDQQASYGLLARGGEVANEESHAVVGNTYGRNIENQEKLSESLQEFQALTTEIAELRSRSALAPHEADRIAPIIERKIDQLKQLKQKLAAHYAATPDPISQKYETLSTIAQLNDVDPEQRSKAVYELAIMNEIFDQTGRYFIDESQGFGSGSQKERLDALMAHKAKVERLEKLTRAREIISSGGNVEEALKYIESTIASDLPSKAQTQEIPTTQTYTEYMRDLVKRREKSRLQKESIRPVFESAFNKYSADRLRRSEYEKQNVLGFEERRAEYSALSPAEKEAYTYMMSNFSHIRTGGSHRWGAEQRNAQWAAQYPRAAMLAGDGTGEPLDPEALYDEEIRRAEADITGLSRDYKIGLQQGWDSKQVEYIERVQKGDFKDDEDEGKLVGFTDEEKAEYYNTRFRGPRPKLETAEEKKQRLKKLAKAQAHLQNLKKQRAATPAMNPPLLSEDEIAQFHRIRDEYNTAEEEVSDLDNQIAEGTAGYLKRVKPAVTAPAAAATTAPSVEDLEAKKTELLKRRETAKAELERLLDTSDAIVETQKEQEGQVQTLEQEVAQLEALVAEKKKEQEQMMAKGLAAEPKVTETDVTKHVTNPETGEILVVPDVGKAAGFYAGPVKHFAEGTAYGGDRSGFKLDPNTGSFTGVVADGVSNAGVSGGWFAQLLTNAALSMPNDTPFTAEAIIQKASETPLADFEQMINATVEEIVRNRQQAESISDPAAREYRLEMSDSWHAGSTVTAGIIKRALAETKKTAAAENRQATAADFASALLQEQERVLSDPEAIKREWPALKGSPYGGFKRATFNSTLSAYRRTIQPESDQATEEFVRVGDSPIVSDAHSDVSRESVNKKEIDNNGNVPSQVRFGSNGFEIVERPYNPVAERTFTTPVADLKHVALMTDAFDVDRSITSYADAETIGEHFSAILADPAKFAGDDDRSLIVVDRPWVQANKRGRRVSARATPQNRYSSSKAADTKSELANAGQAMSFQKTGEPYVSPVSDAAQNEQQLQQIDATIAEEQRTLDAKKQELEALKAERARQEALQQETDAKIEESNQLLEQIDQTQQQINAELAAIAAESSPAASIDDQIASVQEQIAELESPATKLAREAAAAGHSPDIPAVQETPQPDTHRQDELELAEEENQKVIQEYLDYTESVPGPKKDAAYQARAHEILKKSIASRSIIQSILDEREEMKKRAEEDKHSVSQPKIRHLSQEEKSADITDQIMGESDIVYVAPKSPHKQLIESPAFTAFLDTSVGQANLRVNQDSLAVLHDPESEELVAAISDGVSTSWFSEDLADMLTEETTQLRGEIPFTFEEVSKRVNNRSAERLIEKLRKKFRDVDNENGSKHDRESARNILRRVGISDYDAGEKEFNEFLKTFETSGKTPTVGELISFLYQRAPRKKRERIAGATLAAYRRTGTPGNYKHEFMSVGDSLIHSADLGIPLSLLDEDQGGIKTESTEAAGAGAAGIYGRARYYTTQSEKPARVFLASDAYAKGPRGSRDFEAIDPVVESTGFSNLGEQLFDDDGVLGTTRDDRSFIGITGNEQMTPVTRTGVLAEQEDKNFGKWYRVTLDHAARQVAGQRLAPPETPVYLDDNQPGKEDILDSIDIAIAEEQRTLDAKKQELEALKAERARQEALQQETDAKIEESNQLLEQIDRTQQQIDAEKTAIAATAAAGSSPTVSTVTPTAAPAAAVVVSDAGRAAAALDVTETSGDSVLAVLDKAIATSTKDVERSQAAIDALKREFEGVDDADGDIKFVVDNTGYDVSYENKQVTDRTSLRPMVRARMTAGSYDDSHYVSSIDVDELVRQADMVTPDVAARVSAMSKDELDNLRMPKPVLDNEIKRFYKAIWDESAGAYTGQNLTDKEYDDYLKERSKQASQRAKDLLENAGPLKDAALEYYKLPVGEARTALTDKNPDLAELVSKIDTELSDELMYQGRREDPWRRAIAAAETKASPEQLAARLLKTSERAVRAYEEELTVDPDFSARDLMLQVVDAATKTRSDGIALDPTTGNAVIDRKLQEFADTGIPEIKGPTDRVRRTRKRRSPSSVVSRVNRTYTADQIAAARRTVRNLGGRSDLTNKQKQKLSVARDRLHNSSVKRLMTDFGDNKGVLQIANVLAGLTPPDWAADPVQSARISAISSAMDALTPAQLAKLKDVDLTDPSHLDRLSADPQLAPIMQMLATQDVKKALNYGAGTTEYERASKLLDAISKARETVSPSTGAPGGDAEEAKRVFFDLETSIANAPERRKILQAAIGNEGESIDQLFAVADPTSPEEIQRIAADTTMSESDRRARIRELALKVSGRPSLVEGKDVSGSVIDSLVEHAMSGGTIYTQAGIRKELQRRIEQSSSVVGHNIAKFDLPTVYGGERSVPSAVVAKTEDTLPMSRSLYPGSHTLGATYEAIFEKPLADAHDAAADTAAVQAIYPILTDESLRKDTQQRYLEKFGIAPDSPIGRLVATPSIASIADPVEQNKAFQDVAAGFSFYQPLADMQEFTRRVTRSGGVTTLRNGDASNPDEQGWYSMSDEEKSKLMGNMQAMFASDITKRYGAGAQLQTLDDAQMGDFVKYVNDTYLQPNMGAAIGGEYGPMAQLLKSKVGNRMGIVDYRKPEVRKDALTGRTLIDFLSGGAGLKLKYNPDTSTATVGGAIGDLSAGKTIATSAVPASKPPAAVTVSSGGSGAPPVDGPRTAMSYDGDDGSSGDGGGGTGGGGGSGFTTIANAAIDTFHADAVEININGGTVKIDANFSAGAAEKMNKSLVYISNKDGMSVEGGAAAAGGGGYRRVSAADRAALNVLESTKNEIAGKLQTETDPAVRERLRKVLENASRRAISQIVEPKTGVMSDKGALLSLAGSATDPKEALLLYNAFAQSKQSELEASLAEAEASPADTAGRSETIDAIKQELQAVQELISALTELNQVEQRIGSANATRPIAEGVETRKTGYPSSVGGYRRLSASDRASLAVLDAVKNSVSEQLRTEQNPEERNRLRGSLTAASNRAIDEIIKPKATQILGKDFVDTVDSISSSPTESLVHYGQATQSTLNALYGELRKAEALPEDAPGREDWINALNQEISAVQQLIDALTELNQAEQRVGSASGTRNVDSPYGSKFDTDSRGNSSRYRKLSTADQASLNLLEATKNEASTRLRFENDPILRESIRADLTNASQKAIDEVIKPKASSALTPAQLSSIAFGPTDPEGSLVAYNEVAQLQYQDLSSQLTAAEAVPEGTAGREDEIERIKREIAAVQELIDALTELNTVEQRVGSASSTRSIDSTYGSSPTAGSSRYKAKFVDDEIAVLQLARNSFDQSGGTMGFGSAQIGRQFLTDLTRTTSAGVIKKTGIDSPAMAAAIGTVAATAPEAKTGFDAALANLDEVESRTGSTISELSDDVFQFANSLQALKNILEPLSATSPEAVAALETVNGAIDAASTAGREARGSAGVLEADNRKKLATVEEQMQAAASRPGIFSAGRRAREQQAILSAYIKDTYGNQGLNMLMQRGRLRGYRKDGKRVDLDMASIEEQRETMQRMRNAGINITDDDMTAMAKNAGRVSQTRRSAPMGDRLFYAASKIRDSQTLIQTVVDTVASIPNIPQMIGGVIQQFASSATGSNRILTTARGLALNPENYAAALTAADQQRKRFGGSLTSNLSQINSFIPLSNAYGVDISKSVKVARKLAAFDPAQGMEGASIAIKEFLSGNVSSLSRRFEINRSALSKINVGDANKMLDSLDEVLSGMGVTDRLIDEQANAMATKYDKMVGNLESVQINLSSGLVDAVTPALESLLGEQSYFGKNIRERTLNSIAKESLTSYGDQALTDPKNGLGTVSLGTDNKTFAYNADKVLERANTRIMAQASIFNAATGSTTSVAPYRLLGNMKPEERYKIQQDAIKYRLDGMDSSQAIMQALRDNSMRSDYNIGAETNLQRTSLNGAYTTRELAKLNPTAYQKAVTDKREELNSLTASLAEDILKSSTERLPQAKATGTGGRGGIGLTRQQVSLTKANIVKQTDIDTYEVLPKGAKEAITVRIPNIDAFERGTSKDLRGRAAAADLLGMDRSMVGKTYVGRSGPEVTLVGKLSNQDKFGRSVVNVITKEGKNLGVSLIAAGEAAVSFTDALTAVQRKKLETVSQLAADLNLGSMNKEASQVGLGGTPAISDEVRSKYFWDKYGMGIKSAPVAGAALGYGAATGYAALSGATLATVSAPLLGFLGAGALAVGGLYAGGAYLSDKYDNSPEKMRALLKAETENRVQRSKLAEWNVLADLANADAGPNGMLVGGITPEYRKQEEGRTIAAGMRMSAGTEGIVIPDYQAEIENTQQDIIDQAKLAVGKETYLPALEEESKKVEEKYLSGDDWTKRVLGRKITNPFTNAEQPYGSFQPVLFAMQKVAESGDTATFDLLRKSEGATIALTEGTANLLEMRKPIEYAEKVGMTVSARDVAEAKAAPLRDQKRRLEATRAEALKYGETGEADNITKEISQITAEIDSITYTDVEWSKVSEEARKIPITLNNISEYTADQLAFINDYVSKTAANPTDFKREAKEFSSGAMERTAQRRQQRVDTALTSFARQAIMGLGMMSEVDPRSGIITTTDNTAEARAVRMVQRSSLMPANRNSGQDIIKELTDAQIAAVNEQKDIARNNRQTALMAAPEAQLLKSGFTNFAMWMNMVGATAQDLGRSFRTTMDIMSEGNPRFALDFAQQTTGLSYGTMMQMQLIPNRVDATGNPVSSFNGANGQPYSGTGPMFMPYTTGPRGFIKYANDAMRPNASGVREGALGIAPSDWMQLVNNATASNQQLQRTALSNGIQMRDLNKNHQRTLEDITRSGMRQLESIHLNYTRQMYQLTLQAELVKRTTRANAARSIAMADIDPTRKNGIAQQYWAMDMYAQHLGQGDAKGFLKDTATIDVLKQIDPTLAENIAGLETANAAYENTAITDPNRQNLQDAKRAQIEPLLAKLRDLYGKEKDPIRKAAIQAAIARLSPNAQKTVDAQNANAQWLQSELGDAVQEKQFGQQIDDMNFQNSYRSLDRANSAQSVRDAAESGDPLQLANAQRSNASMERGFVQADATLAGLSNSLSGLTGTAYLFDDATTQTFKNIEETGGSAVDGVLNSVEDFKTSFNQQMEDALRNFNNQRLDMIQSFADAAVEIASIVPEEMVPIMQAASQFMNVQRQADLLWLAGRTDEANDLVYKGMLALGDVVYGEGKGKEYADKYQQNYTDMGEIAARDVPQGEWGKFGVNTTAGWALRVKVTEAPNKQVNRTHRDNNKNTHGGFEQDPAAYEPVWP